MSFKPEFWDDPPDIFRGRLTHANKRNFRRWMHSRAHPGAHFHDCGFEHRHDRTTFLTQLERLHRHNRLADVPLILATRRALSLYGKTYAPGKMTMLFLEWLMLGCPVPEAYAGAD